ncbi:AAA family ATPase [Rothia sp. HMSC068E02]|uniref:AlbA family DNA-binding domain-containing protein n=1 Tax=Rothia sp. HMSC068E02 TaxID=1739423 RepID=UPI0008A1D68C|nr:ATP-binding protein [Rothia sp. HMSC068E02]OFQ75559.1 AAA family ATPase [Rothia sp. HMSC068E02]
MFTPIHRALGLEPGNLTMNDINQVIAEKVEETADLDWKESVYDNRDPNWSEEAAKDIAAMANSGGGWIVFGIGDDRKNNAASSVNPIQWAAGNERKILNVAYSKIGPPVVGVEFFKIPCGENPNEGYVVLMHVPDSADAPHFARKGDDAFRAPRRNGSHTVFMTDRDIERGFRERFQRGVEQEKTLQGYFEQAAEALNPEEGVFLAIAAVPVTTKISAGSVDRGTAIQHTNPWAYSYFMTSFLGNYPKDPKVSTNGLFMWGGGDIVKGMRRWVLRNAAQATAKYCKHLHDDGTLTGGYCLKRVRGTQSTSEQYLAGEINRCTSIDVEKALIDFFSLLREHAQERRTSGGFHIRVGLVGNANSPIVLRTHDRFTWDFMSESEPEPIKRFQPVSTFIDPLAPIEDILPPLRTLALDIVNQGGIQNLQVIAGEES